MNTTLHALIFDVDGTLAETERDGHRPAFNSALTAAGYDCQWSAAEYGQLLTITGGKERLRYYFEQVAPAQARNFAALSPAEQTECLADLHRRKTHYYRELVMTGAIGLRPGVLRLLHAARDAGIQLAIATTTTPDNVTALLEHCGAPYLLDWFQVIAAGDVVPHKKPAPDIFLLAMQQLHCAPANCAVIEDSDNGVRAALAAGIKTVVVTVSEYSHEQDFTGAPMVIDQLGEPQQPLTVLGGDHANDWTPAPMCIDIPQLQALHTRVWVSPS